MAVSSGFTHGPENSGIRDVNADIEAAVKARIEEYKIHGRDTDYLEERLRGLQNAKKGRRKSSEETVDDGSASRDDNDGCAVDEQEKQREKRESGKSPAHKKRAGVPDQLTEKTSDPEAQAGPAEDIPDQESPWPKQKVEPAVRQPDLPTPGQGQGSQDPDPEAAKKAAAQKAADEKKAADAKAAADKKAADEKAATSKKPGEAKR